MTSYNPVLKNGASGAIFYVSLEDAVTVGRFKANPTLAAGDVLIVKDGGASANLTTLPSASPASSKFIKVTLSQTETNADNVTIIFSDQTTPPEWNDFMVNIWTVARNFDGIDGVLPAVGTAAGAAGGLFIAGTNAPVTITGSGDALTLTSTGGNGSGLNASGNGTGSGIKGTGGSTGVGIAGVGGATSGTGIKGIATAGGSIGIEAQGATSGVGFSAKGGTTGAGAALIGGATSGAGLTVTTTSGDGLSITPTAGSAIVATANGTSKHGIVATGGTAGTSDGFKASAGTGGVDIRGNITGNLTGTTSDFTTALTESYAADGVAPTPAQALFMIQAFQQEKSVAGTTMTVKKLDGATTAATFTLDSSTAPTSITRAT